MMTTTVSQQAPHGNMLIIPKRQNESVTETQVEIQDIIAREKYPPVGTAKLPIPPPENPFTA